MSASLPIGVHSGQQRSFSEPASPFNQVADILKGKSSLTKEEKESVLALLKSIAETAQKNNETDTQSKAEAAIKWLKTTEFDPSLIATDMESVEYLVKTGLIFTVQLFKNSASMLFGDEMTIKNEGGKALILKEGRLTFVSEVKKQIPVELNKDGSFYKFDGWTFTHPQGFIPQDKFAWKDIRNFPIAQLKPDLVQTLRTQAGAGPDQPYILQPIVTHENTGIKNEALKSLAKNFEKFTAKHAHALIIDDKGMVFSAGTMPENSELEALHSGFGSSLAATGNTKINIPDYQLPRINLQHHTTYIPMTKDQADKAFTVINEANVGVGMRFNMLRQNCGRFVLEIIRSAGCAQDLDIKSDFPSLLYQSLPDIKHIPIVGGPLDYIKTKVEAIAQPIIDSIQTVWKRTPEGLRSGLSKLKDAITFIPNKLRTLAISSIMIIGLGGSRAVSKPRDGEEDTIRNEEKLTRFQKLFRGVLDMFDEEHTRIYHTYFIMKWMQGTSEKYRCFDNSKKAILPIDPAAGAALDKKLSD